MTSIKNITYNNLGIKGDKGDKGERGIMGPQGPPGFIDNTNETCVVGNYKECMESNKREIANLKSIIFKQFIQINSLCNKLEIVKNITTSNELCNEQPSIDIDRIFRRSWTNTTWITGTSEVGGDRQAKFEITNGYINDILLRLKGKNPNGTNAVVPLPTTHVCVDSIGITDMGIGETNALVIWTTSLSVNTPSYLNLSGSSDDVSAVFISTSPDILTKLTEQLDESRTKFQNLTDNFGPIYPNSDVNLINYNWHYDQGVVGDLATSRIALDANTEYYIMILYINWGGPTEFDFNYSINCRSPLEPLEYFPFITNYDTGVGNYFFTLSDTFGDGWNGSTLTIVMRCNDPMTENDLVSYEYTYTLTDGYIRCSDTFDLNNNCTYTITVSAGAYSLEIAWKLWDSSTCESIGGGGAPYYGSIEKIGENWTVVEMLWGARDIALTPYYDGPHQLHNKTITAAGWFKSLSVDTVGWCGTWLSREYFVSKGLGDGWWGVNSRNVTRGVVRMSLSGSVRTISRTPRWRRATCSPATTTATKCRGLRTRTLPRKK